MKTHEECFPCFERQASEACALCGMSAKVTADVLDAVRAKMRTFSLSHSPVAMAAEIHGLVRSAANGADPYEAIKQRSNRACQDAMPALSQWMTGAVNRLEMATKLAIAGNVIDYGAYSAIALSPSEVTRAVQISVTEPLVGADFHQIRRLVDEARKVLYIGDNAGECFLDTFLLDELPCQKLTYVVRGGPILNDATEADARAAGIHERCEIIDTGDNAPGVLLERCSADFRRVFSEADLVIAKGQGNYESLSEVTGATRVFLTKVKCPVIARDMGFAKGRSVIRIINDTARDHQLRGEEPVVTNAEVHHA